MLPVIPLSALPGIIWPALPTPAGTVQLALLYQFEQSEKWPPEQLACVQYQQLTELLNHAWKTSQHYRLQMEGMGFNPGQSVDMEWLRRFPLLTRKSLQQNYELIKSLSPPETHGPAKEGQSSGSTGRPVRYLSTEYTRTMWRTLSLRNHLWNARDFSAKFAIIRANIKQPISKNWGELIAQVYPSAACPMLDIRTPIKEQARWLVEQNPHYLLTFPSNLRGLVEALIDMGGKLPQLREIITVGETLTPDTRDFIEAFCKVPIRDIYSASEVGIIALQCHHGHYHVQENLLVEILDKAGHPVAPGEIGQVVITDLHNFALPLIRYAIGDYAEAGEAGCPCGRSLQRINRIVGRSRNLLSLPDGRRFWPMMGIKNWPKSIPIRRHQVVQKSLYALEVRLETPRPLTIEERTQLSVALCSSLGHPFQVSFIEMPEMPPAANGKFEDFLSEIDT